MSSQNQGRKATTIWNFFFLNVRFIISMVNGIFIIPLYLHFIDNSIYGAWLATGNILSWIAIVDPGVGDVLLQKVSYAYGENKKKEVGNIISASVIISLLLFLIAIVAGYFASFYVSDIANVPLQNKAIITASFRIALWGTGFVLLANTFSNICLAHQKTKQLGIILNIIAIASIVLNIILLNFKFGVYAIAYANFFRGGVTLLIVAFYSFILMRKNQVTFGTNFKFIKSFSQIFAFTFLGRIIETISSNIDLLLVSRFIGPEYVTVLDISRKPISMVSGLTNNFSISMLPTLPHLFGTKDKKRIDEVISKFLFFLIWISAFITCGFIIFNHSLVFNWVGEKFWIGYTNNLLICFYFLLMMIAYSLSNITYSMGDIKNNSIVSIFKSIIYLVALLLLGKAWGITGILVSSLLLPLIMLTYFPYKIYKSDIISHDNYKLANKEVFKVLAIVVLSIIIARYYVWGKTWTMLLLTSSVFVLFFIGYIITTKSILLKEIKNFKLKRNG